MLKSNLINTENLGSIEDMQSQQAKQILSAAVDIKEGFQSWRIWLLLSWQDIRLRYRRSTLGPFWLTLSMGITIFTMSLLYSKLFDINLAEYCPSLASGMLVWGLISTSLTEGTNIFIGSENFLKQMRQAYSTFILRTVARNFIIFLHNLIIMVPIIIFFQIKVNYHTLWVFVGLLLILINAASFGAILAVFGTRFRDIAQLINSLIQVVFFLTPIMWSPATLPEQYRYVVDLNPFAQFIEMVRNPLMGIPPSSYALIATLLITCVGLVCAYLIFAKFRSRITYWL